MNQVKVSCFGLGQRAWARNSGEGKGEEWWAWRKDEGGRREGIRAPHLGAMQAEGVCAGGFP